jgi:hypothetical protein
MRVDLKYAGQLLYAMTVQFVYLIIIWPENNVIQIVFENSLFFGLGYYF